MFDLTQQVALVTGGARGIGKGIARVLGRAGARVIIADIDAAAGQACAAELGGHYLPLDVSRQADCRRVVDDVIASHGQLDILCSNTGIFPQCALADMTEQEWDRMHNINLKGTFFMVQAALAVMRPRGYGRVVITSSITGPITGFPGWSHYAASKAGQLGFMRSAALECARDGVTINAVMPGNILTEGLQAQGEAYLEQMKAAIPSHCLGTPEDIGHAACFLASREARYITGQTLVVDGGQVLPESPEALAATA
jgi:3-oxoacyl-[acyl-carrier protein] reductase